MSHIKARIGTSPYAKMYGEPRDVSHFRAFRYRVFAYLNLEQREKEKNTLLAWEAICLGRTDIKQELIMMNILRTREVGLP
jgi:hypothetical protein